MDALAKVHCFGLSSLPSVFFDNLVLGFNSGKLVKIDEYKLPNTESASSRFAYCPRLCYCLPLSYFIFQSLAWFTLIQRASQILILICFKRDFCWQEISLVDPTRLRTASKTLREFSVETKGIFNTRTLCLLRYGELPRCVYIMRPSFVLFTISYSCFWLYNYYTLFWKIVITLFSLCTHRLSKSHYFQHEFEKVDVISVIGNLYFCIFPFKGQWKLYSSLALCTLWLYLFVWIKPLA